MNIRRHAVLAVCLLLASVTFAAYWPALSNGFVNYDDQDYVTENYQVRAGLSWEGVVWAFCNPVACNWHPVTVLSHMLDCHLFGLRPWGHHLTSVLLHAVNTVLVFLLLRNLTGALWRGVFVAALFGLHPLHVESVAWASERKDVLSACFGFLSLVFYARYAQGGSIVESRKPKALATQTLDPCAPSLDYGLALFFFALGLMSKPMLVTWPFVMLLLDYWPLRRLQPSTAWRLLAEKIPFFALAAVTSVVTLVVQKQGGALEAGERVPLGSRSANALISYCCYLGKLFWPTNMAFFYPHPRYWPLETVLLAGGLLLGISVLLIVKRGRYPVLLIGWLWYCGTLVPVIGLVQVGSQAMADRYAYIPSLGVLILAIWGTHELARRWHYGVTVLSVAGAAASVLCMVLTRQQLGHWKDSEALSRHALQVTENNYLAHKGLGAALLGKGQIDEAITQCQEAIRLQPGDAVAHYNLGNAFVRKGQMDEAISQYREAIRLEPGDAAAHYNLGNALDKKGQIDEAISQYHEAIRLKPNDANAYSNLGNALVQKGQIDEAIRQLQEATHLSPEDADAHNNLGSALAGLGRLPEAVTHYEAALRLEPDHAGAHYNLGKAYESIGQMKEAMTHYSLAIRAKPEYADAHNNLGAALAAEGQFQEAEFHLKQAVRLKPDSAEAHNNLGNILTARGRNAEAVIQFSAALRLKPDYLNAHSNLGLALVRMGKIAEALEQYDAVLRLNPDDVDALCSKAWILSAREDPRFRNGPEAVRLATRAASLTQKRDAGVLDALASAYAESGRFADATNVARRAEQCATASGQLDLAARIRERLQLYQSGRCYREP